MLKKQMGLRIALRESHNARGSFLLSRALTRPRLTYTPGARMEIDYKVKLEVFEGPLDLLLFLVKRDEIDIYDISLERITRQYPRVSPGV